MFDPSNHAVKPNFLGRSSVVHVPGPASLSWETGNVPHGEIHHHFLRVRRRWGRSRFLCLHSARLRHPRKQTYPVLYLLHGFQRTTRAPGRWWAVPNVILDNLIAQGKAKPMLLVMPPRLRRAGGFITRFRRFPRTERLTDRNFDKFPRGFAHGSNPRVEGEYLVVKDRNSRAIDGAFDGGSESLLTGLNTLDKFWLDRRFQFRRHHRRV